MSIKIDLHVHTNHSFDSTETIKDILDVCVKENIDTIAICDHNVISGAKLAIEDKRLTVIGAIEIDCYYKEDVIHVIGYGVELKDTIFKKVVEHYPNELKRISKKRIDLFNAYFGIEIDEEKCKKLSGNDFYTNVEITQVMLQDHIHPAFLPYTKGERSDSPVANFYWDYCALNKPCYVEMNLPSLDEVVETIQSAKGVVIVAHPAVNIAITDDVLDDLVKSGVEGFEISNNYHTKQEMEILRNYCEKRDLLITIGSDFHGSTKPNIQLGQTNYPWDNQKIKDALILKMKSKKEEI